MAATPVLSSPKWLVFDPAPYSDPAVEMAEFARRRYTWHTSRTQTLEDWTAAWQLIVVAGGPMSAGIRQQKALYDVGGVSEDTTYLGRDVLGLAER
jgi:hypothetical protein